MADADPPPPAEAASITDASVLVTTLLVTITDALGLEEVGDPFMTLREGQNRIGAVRVWQPPSLNRMRSHAVEKLVYLHLHTNAIAVQWIFAFSAAASLVPHFVFGLTGAQKGLGVLCDLISKIPRGSQSVPFNRLCYEPLAATQRHAVSTLGGGLALSNDDHAGVTSDRLLLMRLAAGCSIPALADAARAYAQHWLALHELGNLLRLPSSAGATGSRRPRR